MFMSNNQPRHRNTPPRIMVVDDEKDILRIIKRDLESNDSKITFKVDAFSDSESALNAFNNHPNDYYDLVLTDIRMPKMNGFELYKEMDKIDNDVKVCFITAFEVYYEALREVFPSMEVECFIRKPIEIGNLVKRIKNELNLPNL